MDAHKQLFIANGEDKTDSVISYQFDGEKCRVMYENSSKVYSYNRNNVHVLDLQKTIDPESVIVTAGGVPISDIKELLDYGNYYRIVRDGKKDLSYPSGEITILHNCLSNKNIKNAFEYFKETAYAVSLVQDNGVNILGRQYEKISSVSNETVLASYLNEEKEPEERKSPHLIIYPFGLNQSQKKAVENALSSQVSIIQGPPGTGKTQTILNIIANAVLNNKTVAVVSNNNSAISNVAEKLAKKDASFLTAFLGSSENKEHFLQEQSGAYPNMEEWVIEKKERIRLSGTVKQMSEELNEMLNAKNKIAEIDQQLMELKPEQHYFCEYYSAFKGNFQNNLSDLASQKILSLWAEYEGYAEKEDKLSIFKKFLLMFRFNISASKLFAQSPEKVIPYLQNQFYITKKFELISEKTLCEKKLSNYSFENKMEELSQLSLILFRAELAERYKWKMPRKKFEMRDFRSKSFEFNQEYPVVLSTTYSIKGTLNIGYVYDYLIIDEASQVDLATGVLAFSCAKNIVIVGDLKQLPNVLTVSNIQNAESIWKEYALNEIYHFSEQSLLSSATERWKNCPDVLLREHYRCHPKIIGFCNQKFYNGQLIIMTEDHDEENVLTMYRTVAGNHARGHMNQRQIDVIKNEIIPQLKEKGCDNIGIITPYRDQASEIEKQLGMKYEVSTVHKFQGREKEAIIITSVDNQIGDFVDDPNMLNVAVSRAVKSLSVIVSSNSQNDKTNYGALAKYIEYNNCEIINSNVFSVFDLLYKGYAEERRNYLKKYGRVSEYDSENLLYSVIKEILIQDDFSEIECAVHVSLSSLIKNYDILSEEEKVYAQNPLTHTDFLLFNRMNKLPIMAIETDSPKFHKEGSKQAARDAKKNSIFDKCGIPLLRIKTNESGEKERIESTLRSCI